jgi:spermidine synthase
MSVRIANAESSVPVWTAWAFAGATLLGAFLLFQIQPLIGKFILPWFGGAPAVWTACMLFFQVALLGGYAYSHLLVGRLAPRGQAIVQCVLMLAALAVLPIAPSDSWKPADGGSSPTLRILLLLTATVGLPYFVLATTSPLIQAWFSRGFPGRTPYRLYSLSNIGSLAALLSYPFLFEPALDLPAQARLWSWCFAGYAALTGFCAAAVWQQSPLSLRERARVRAFDNGTICHDAPSPTGLHRALWLLLPAFASVILLATTNHVCQDVAAVPFLWIAPLALYLLSFIVCFDGTSPSGSRWYLRPIWAVPTVVGIAAMLAGDKVLGRVVESTQQAGLSLTFAQQLVLHLGTMFCICMICHGELVRLKPCARRLTEFYLLMAAGGALGGVLVGFVAPHIFDTFLEWRLGMLAAYAMATLVLFLAVPKRGWKRMPALLTSGFAAGGFLAALFWQFDWSEPRPGDPRLVDCRRNFYGVVSIWDIGDNDPAKHHVSMIHGTVLHGRQFLAAEKRGEPVSYYLRESGIGRAILELQRRKPRLRMGIVGLGAGSLASYARPRDRFIFYEINPAVRDMAEKHFTYLSDARSRGAEVGILMGDARLTLESQTPQDFDLLVMDAFSGDSVPVHLLTHEAMLIYRRHVAAESVLAFHATNTYLYLFPVVRALADDARLLWRRGYLPYVEESNLRSDWVVVSGSESFLNSIPNRPPSSERQRDDFKIPVWTDHNNNQFEILIGRK